MQDEGSLERKLVIPSQAGSPCTFKAMIVSKYLCHFLPSVIQTLRSQGVEPVISHNTRDWEGQPKIPYTSDHTLRIAAEHRVRVISGSWATEADQRNDTIQELSDCDYVMIVDTDELFLDVERLKMHIGSSDVVTGMFIDYWKTPCFAAYPPRSCQPVLAVRPHVRFHHQRLPNTKDIKHSLLPIHHFGYCYPDDVLKWKCANCTDDQVSDPDWYEKVWKAWDKDHTIQNLGIGNNRHNLLWAKRIKSLSRVQAAFDRSRDSTP